MFTSKTLENLKEKQVQKNKELTTIISDIEFARDERDDAFQALARENDAYQLAIRVVEEAKARMNAAEERMKEAAKLTKQLANEYSSLVKNKVKISDEIIDICLKIDTIELEQNLSVINEEEKQVKKAEKKAVKKLEKKYIIIGDWFLFKIQRMPDDIKRLICGYLPYDVRASLIKDSFNNVMAKCNGPEPAYIFISFLNYIGTCPEFLPLLSRKEARRQIPSLIERGYHWRTYTYCIGRKTCKPITKLVKNKINWAVELAQAGNPEFAYKVMKTIIVFGSDFSRIKPMPFSGTERAKRYLTIQDLPPNYR